ncbi:MAG: AbrB/MazE/SpoVT family DNA-binding domain-containing protein [Methanotrichaceae archaeon]|jgi:AbrB family looped-hinge helix DNA binding protein
MPLTKVDDKGRVLLPSDLRQRIGLKQGDELLIDEMGEGTFILKKVDVRAMLRDAIIKAKSIDNEKLEREIEEESNRFARDKFKISDR